MKKIILFFQNVKESIDSIRNTLYRIQYLLENMNDKVESFNIEFDEK